MPAARSHRSGLTIAIETITAAIGIVLMVAAASANQPWLDDHFLPSFFVPRGWYVFIESVVRCAIAAAGAVLVLWRFNVAQSLTRAPATAVNVAMALVFAFASGELALRWIHLRPTEWLVREEEPRRQEDPELGWVLAPERTGRRTVSGRTVEYAIDDSGYRVRRADEAVDHERPAMVFAGESVMFGEGLTWDESIPAQVSAVLGVQSANLAVHGYSTDQIYLRLTRELPRFKQPVAVVAIFMTELFGRNLDDDRPHLAPGLVWHRAARTPALMSIAGLLVPYRRDTTIDRGLRATREAFLAMADLARRRGATPLVIVPQFGAEDELQRTIRQRVMKDDIPTVLVSLDPDWRLAWDRHPNAHAAHVIAAAVAARLQRR
jgi:hypothetical protein